MALAGIVIGLMGAALSARTMTSLLYGISALDPVTMGSASIVLFAIVLGACVMPARRAAKIDPIQALRAE
jgi:ABC-type antimicrobial peptide transport system permease subunit